MDSRSYMEFSEEDYKRMLNLQIGSEVIVEVENSKSSTHYSKVKKIGQVKGLHRHVVCVVVGGREMSFIYWDLWK